MISTDQTYQPLRHNREPAGECPQTLFHVSSAAAVSGSLLPVELLSLTGSCICARPGKYGAVFDHPAAGRTRLAA
jgi:hypothetical protein